MVGGLVAIIIVFPSYLSRLSRCSRDGQLACAPSRARTLLLLHMGPSLADYPGDGLSIKPRPQSNPGRRCPVIAVPALPHSTVPASGFAFSHLWFCLADSGVVSLSGLPHPRTLHQPRRNILPPRRSMGTPPRRLTFSFFPLLTCQILLRGVSPNPTPPAGRGPLRGSARGPTGTVRLA